MPQKRMDQALGEFRTALSLDPLSPIVNTNYAVVLTTAGRYPEAFAQFRKIMESEPAFNLPHFYLSQLYAMTGRFSEALSELQKFNRISGSWSADAQGYNRRLAAVPVRVGLSALALSSALVGDRDKAFEYLNKAYSIEDEDLIQTLRYPALDPIRSDPRYAERGE
jgi:tetratricopeptide (TPR) repeat protein